MCTYPSVRMAIGRKRPASRPMVASTARRFPDRGRSGRRFRRHLRCSNVRPAPGALCGWHPPHSASPRERRHVARREVARQTDPVRDDLGHFAPQHKNDREPVVVSLSAQHTMSGSAISCGSLAGKLNLIEPVRFVRLVRELVDHDLLVGHADGHSGRHTRQCSGRRGSSRPRPIVETESERCLASRRTGYRIRRRGSGASSRSGACG